MVPFLGNRFFEEVLCEFFNLSLLRGCDFSRILNSMVFVVRINKFLGDLNRRSQRFKMRIILIGTHLFCESFQIILRKLSLVLVNNVSNVRKQLHSYLVRCIKLILALTYSIFVHFLLLVFSISTPLFFACLFLRPRVSVIGLGRG